MHGHKFEGACDNTGYNNIDIEAAKARGVPICTSPGYNAASVAEGAIMMMLMLVRRVHEQEVPSRPVVLHSLVNKHLCMYIHPDND